MPVQAYVDESGGRAHSTKSTDHFVMTAVMFRDADHQRAIDLLAQLRLDLHRQPGQELHWVNIKSHQQRLHVAKSLGAAQFLTLSSVVVCKRLFPKGDQIHQEDVAYLYTLRYLLERLTWWGKGNGGKVTYTLAHIVRFPMYKLRDYEKRLKVDASCQIKWNYISPGQIDQPSRTEELQLADLAASATAAAFEPDDFGNTELRYLEEMAPRLYRHKGNLTSYGLKMHPWNDVAQATYPWVQTL